MEHNQQGRRPHFHRGRRGSERRGNDRRVPQQLTEQSGRSSNDQLDVEQIMREIRARIAQRHGIELSTQQIQELAARRLEAILDPRSINPSLLEQLRRNAGTPVEAPLPAIDGGFTFDDSTLYETHRGLLRFLRRLFNPILKLLFNPNPLVQTLSTQARLNKEAAARETERERRQTEWNALHFEILNRLVTEVSRASIEMQALSTRVDALAGRVDFADRRVRTLENAPTSAQSRSGETAGTPRREAAAATGPARPADAASPTQTVGPEGGAGEGGPRRKRRRRRGRRSGGGLPEGTAPGMSVAPISTGESELSGAEELEGDESGDEDDGEASVGADVSTFAEGTGAPSADKRTDESRPAVESIAETASAAVTDTSRDRAEATGPPPVQPTPPSDEPVPAAPVDHPDPGPPDR